MNCEICDEQFLGIEDLRNHVESDEHEDKLKLCHKTSGNFATPDYYTVIDYFGLFYCAPCSMSFCSFPDIRQHSRTDDHEIMILATGIGFDALIESLEECTDPSPHLYCCLICSYRSFYPNNYKRYLEEKIHEGNVASFLRMSRNKEGNAHEFRSSGQVTKNRNRRSSSQYRCKSCDVNFSNQQSLDQHFKEDNYKHIMLFSGLGKEDDDEIKDFIVNENALEIRSASVTFPYCCKFCKTLFYGSASYKLHLRSSFHLRIRLFLQKLLDVNGKEKSANLKQRARILKRLYSSEKPLCCCDLCYKLEFNYGSYELHLKAEIHNKVQKRFLELLTEIELKRDQYHTVHDIVTVNEMLGYCGLCETRFKQYGKHSDSEFHESLVRLLTPMFENHTEKKIILPLVDFYYCEICDYYSGSPNSYNDHVKGRKHRSKVNRLSQATSKSKEKVGNGNTNVDVDRLDRRIRRFKMLRLRQKQLKKKGEISSINVDVVVGVNVSRDKK